MKRSTVYLIVYGVLGSLIGMTIGTVYNTLADLLTVEGDTAQTTTDIQVMIFCTVLPAITGAIIGLTHEMQLSAQEFSQCVEPSDTRVDNEFWEIVSRIK